MTGEWVTDIQRLDPDWWLVKNEAGQASPLPSTVGKKILTTVSDRPCPEQLSDACGKRR